MELREEQVTIRGVTFTVREMSAREIIPVMDLMRSDEDGTPPPQSFLSEKMFEASVSRDGQAVTLDNLSGSIYMKLLPVVMRLNGMTEGND